MARGKPWYEPDVRWKNFGVKYSFSPWAVAGEDIALPQGTPITAVFAGSVTQHYYDGGGGQLVIKIDNTGLSRGIPYYWYAHLDAINPSLGVGAHINEGQFLGYSGGQLTAGGPAYPPGYAHHPNDGLHSTGPHILHGLFRVGYINAGNITADLNPYWILDYAKAIGLPWGEGDQGRASSGSAFRTLTSTTYEGSSFPLMSPLAAKKTIDLAPDGSVAEVLSGIDQSMTFGNVFNVSARKVGLNPNGGGIGVTSPVDWIAQVGTNIGNNATVAILRFILIIIGFYIIYTIIDKAFNISSMVGNAALSAIPAGRIAKTALRKVL